MTTNLATATPLAAPLDAPEAPARRHLEIVTTRAQRRARPKLGYAIITVAAIGAVLLGQLLMSIAVSGGAYDIARLKKTETGYQRQQQALTEQLRVASSTQNLVNKAEALGMVSGGNPLFLDLATGAVAGAPSSAQSSLLGAQGNLVANALLPSATAAQQAAADQEAAQQAAAQQAASAGDDEGGVETDGTAAGTAGSTAASSASPGASPSAGASPSPTSSPSVASTAGGMLPSPVTR